MAYKVQIPPAVMRELDTKREDLVSAAPEAKAQARVNIYSAPITCLVLGYR